MGGENVGTRAGMVIILYPKSYPNPPPVWLVATSTYSAK